MPVEALGLMNTKLMLDGSVCEIRGIVPNVPLSSIKRGQLIELLVVTVDA